MNIADARLRNCIETTLRTFGTSPEEDEELARLEDVITDMMGEATGYWYD